MLQRNDVPLLVRVTVPLKGALHAVLLAAVAEAVGVVGLLGIVAAAVALHPLLPVTVTV